MVKDNVTIALIIILMVCILGIIWLFWACSGRQVKEEPWSPPLSGTGTSSPPSPAPPLRRPPPIRGRQVVEGRIPGDQRVEGRRGNGPTGSAGQQRVEGRNNGAVGEGRRAVVQRVEGR